MSDYLAKIAASGARTSAEATARPPASGPPLLPTLAFPSPDEIAEIESSTAPKTPESTVPPTTAPNSAILQEPVQASTAASAEPPTGGQVVSPTWPDKPPVEAPERTLPGSANRPAQPAEAVSPLAALSRQLAPEPAPIIRAPKALRPPEMAHEPKVAAALETAHRAAKQEATVALPQSITGAIQDRKPAIAPVSQPSDTGVSDGANIQIGPVLNPEQPAASAVPEVIPRPALPVPKAQPAPVALPVPSALPEPATDAAGASAVEPPARKEARITIGRLDVQVNNHPPALQERAAATTTNEISPDALERRYLDRFRLRP